MTYTIKTSSYNARRYGRPWIAEVRGKEFIWGDFEGRPGEAGVLVISAEPGALIAQGQKDIRKGRGGVGTYWMAMPNGMLWSKGLETEYEAKQWARKGWKEYAAYRTTLDGDKNQAAAKKMLDTDLDNIISIAQRTVA